VEISPMTLSGTTGQTLTGTSTVKGVRSSISISYPSNLPTTITRNTDGTFKLTSQYTCTTVGTFTPALKATIDGTVYTVPVTVTCTQGVQINPMTLSGTTGQTLTGTSTVKGVKSTITVSAPSTLPTTVTKNADGTYTLTSQYTCTTAGTFSPALTATIDGTVYPVSVTVTCAQAVEIAPITMSGMTGQTLTGTSLVKGVKSSISVSYPSTLPTTITRNADGTYTLTSQYACTTAGTFNPTLTATIDGKAYPVSVTVTCTQAVQISAMTMSGTKGQTLTGTSLVKGVRSTLTVTYDAALPTTVKKNTDGTYTLTSTYKCTTTGTFKPSLVAKVDGVNYPVSVTVTCK
jgi:hypothetical protein